MTIRFTCGVLIALSLFVSRNLPAQDLDISKATVDEAEWYEGTITLSDGSTLSGLVKLNTKTGILGYENGATSKSFTPRTVLAFNYFDAAENKKRDFLSIAYNDLTLKKNAAKKHGEKPYAEVGVPQFFEVLVECKSLALISTIGRLNIKQRTGAGGMYGSGGGVGFGSGATVYSHNETLLILTEDGSLEVVLDITNEETGGTLFDNNRSRGNFKEAVLREYTSPYFEQLEEYAKARKLKFKKRDDLIQIFEYYKSLSAG